mmetsp:Transcript_40753/g.53677  ORF Transcript_40753/g.53677 Transcript_40753/m.53677 type:complete len:273 (+) Transcript_40753:179-997(+)
MDDKAYIGGDVETGNAPLSPPPLARAKSSRDYKNRGGVLPVTSHVYLTPDQYYQGDHTKELRAGFIRKVYSLLAVQMLMTIGICCLCMFVDGIREYILGHIQGCFWGFFAAMIFSLIALMCNKDKVPVNYFWFFTFTVFTSFYLGMICGIYYETGGAFIVLEALILTCGLFIGLTLFTCVTKIDFTGMGPYLFALLWLLIIWGVLIPFFGYSTYYLYCIFGVILFSFYVIYDTSKIMLKFGYDDYLIAAIELYLDIVNLFLLILSLLGGGRR